MKITINRVELNNYRSCLLTKVKIGEKLTTLIGANGAGKSNILKGIQLLSQGKSNRLFEDGDVQELEYFLQSSVKIDFTIDDKELVVILNFAYEINDKNEDKILSSRFKIRDKASPSRRFIVFDTYSLNHAINKRPNIISKNHLRRVNSQTLGFESLEAYRYLKDVKYFSATQFSNPSLCPISFEYEEIGQQRLSSLSSDSYHKRFLYDIFTTSNNDKASFSRFLNVVGKHGIGLIEDIEFKDYNLPTTSYEVRSGGQIKQIERNKLLIIPSVKVDNIVLSPNQLSEGTFKALALIYYIMNDSSNLLLIEEPEVCVHYGLLNSIMELIRIESANKQIVITTHSDSVLDKLSPENVIVVKKSLNIGTTASSIPESLSKNDYKALKSYLEDYGNLGEYWRDGGLYND